MTAAEVVDLARTLRDLPLRKSPSISEVIDAARAATVLRRGGGDHTSLRQIRDILLATLLKYTGDADLVRARLDGSPAEAAPAPAEPAGERPERATVASRPANTTTAVFRGRGGGGGRGGVGIGARR